MIPETTLITGASSGIGLHLAHEFAWHDHPLVIVAPVESELNTLAEELRRLYGVPVQVIAIDLERSQAAQEIFTELQSIGIEIDILVNNAGHGYYGKWWDQSIERDLSMMKLNIEAVLRLTETFLPPMLSRNHGRILNTASIRRE